MMSTVYLPSQHTMKTGKVAHYAVQVLHVYYSNDKEECIKDHDHIYNFNKIIIKVEYH